MPIYYEVWEHDSRHGDRRLSTHIRYDAAAKARDTAEHRGTSIDLRTFTPDGRLMTPRNKLCGHTSDEIDAMRARPVRILGQPAATDGRWRRRLMSPERAVGLLILVIVVLIILHVFANVGI